MGKKSTPRRLGDNEAMAMARMLRGSPQKLNLVAASIRGMKVERALTALEFSHKKAAVDVRKVMKRFRARARGRSAKLLKPFSRLTIVVREAEEVS